MPYKKGDHWIICDRCGFKVYRSQARKEWNGWLVCKDKCYEDRHPQEFVPPQRMDRQWVEDARPRRPDVYIEDEYPDGVTPDDL